MGWDFEDMVIEAASISPEEREQIKREEIHEALYRGLVDKESHEFQVGEVCGVILDNVCAYWKTEKLQCVKSRAAHISHEDTPKESLRSPVPTQES